MVWWCVLRLPPLLFGHQYDGWGERKEKCNYFWKRGEFCNSGEFLMW